MKLQFQTSISEPSEGNIAPAKSQTGAILVNIYLGLHINILVYSMI